MDTDVLICGAGPTGLALAIELARRDIPFRLIEKSPMPFAGSRGKGLQPRTLEVFEQMGVADRIVAGGGPYPPLRTYASDGTIREGFADERRPSSPAEPYGQVIMSPQFRTEAILRDRLAELDHSVEYGTEIVRFQPTAKEVKAWLRTPKGQTTIKARYLIGADGGKSFVRHALDVGFPGDSLPYRAIVADLRLDGLERDAWHRWTNSGPEKQIALCPLIGTDLFQLQAPMLMDAEPNLSPAALQALIRERTGRDDIVIRDITWSSAYRGSARLADRYVNGRVILAGDAAHIHPPTGGQGLNTSVQDAWNLGWKLATVLTGGPDLLPSYESERREVAAGMLGLSLKLLDAARQQNDMRRDRSTQQLDIGYPESPLNLDTRQRGLRAGDRAPDAPFRGAAGQPIRLFSLFGPYWTLLAFATTDMAPRQGLRIHHVGRDILDNDGHIRTAYDFQPGEMVLIRPDGYVGAIVTNAADLNGYWPRAGL